MKALLIMLCYALTLLAFNALGRALASEPPCTVRAMTNSNDQILKETFHVAGDAPDPAGTGLRGTAPGYRFTQSALGHPMCHYSFGTGGDMIVELDVYALADQPMYVHLLCPHCQVRGQTSALRITAESKKMSYDPHGIARTFPGWTDAQMAQSFPRGTGGLISIERFKCAWEYDNRRDVNRGVEITSNMCDFEAVIENNVVRRVSRRDLPRAT